MIDPPFDNADNAVAFEQSEPRDLTPEQVVEAEIRAAEIVLVLDPNDAWGIDWISDDEKEFLDDVAAESSLGDGLGDGSLEVGRALPRPVPRPRESASYEWLSGHLEVAEDLGDLEERTLDLSDDEMEGWRRWSCYGEPATVGQAAGWLAHQMVAHAAIRAWWHEEDAPNPWWHPLPWQSDDQDPIDVSAFRERMKWQGHPEFLADLCARHFYAPIIRTAKAIHFHWDYYGAFEHTALWVIEVDGSMSASVVPARNGGYIVAVGSAVFQRRGRALLRSIFGVASQHHYKDAAVAAAQKIIAEHGTLAARTITPDAEHFGID